MEKDKTNGDAKTDIFCLLANEFMIYSTTNEGYKEESPPPVDNVHTTSNQ